MSAITASMVAALRAKTDAPMMECKKALTEAEGDMDKAEELLRVKLGSKASKAASRVTAEGIVAAYIDTASEKNEGALIELNCETDFVSKNDDFLAFGKRLAEMVATRAPADVAALSALDIDGVTVEATRSTLIGKIGENISIRRFKRFSGGGKLVSYLHGTRIGVMVEYGGDDVAAKDVAMHVAAMKPVALSSSEVPAELIEKERSVAAGKAAEDAKVAEAAGKPVQSAEIVVKRIEGSVQKYLKEVSLFNQAFVKNDKQTVEQMLKERATTIKSFTMYVVGEGIERRTDDFAAEVAAQIAAAKGA
ncbi:translation elongation factor Ts [Methylibium sp.]|uniref:translation elongation factor Ts n=1 Tax=Methylibium sp. TaxID=2067992 RepID=UPI001802077C|nr:translation elongation factor Ts [Methylibium sp.]MBA3588268.1 elongation factor Ts [Methylibium sp.]